MNAGRHGRGPAGRRAYLDWNASAPLRAEARAALVAALDATGNPSSVHAEGRAARAIVERARAQVAALADCDPGEVVFTSGATEALGLALDGGAALCSPFEHDAVAARAQILSVCPESGAPLADRSGVFRVAALGAGLGGLHDKAIFALAAANSETGVMQPLAETFEKIAEAATGLCDATQVLGKAGFSFRDSRADFAAVSAHKLGGPRGVGALILRDGAALASAAGGGQESRRRAGTENVAGIAGFGAAAAAAQRDLEAGIWNRVAQLRNILENRMTNVSPETIIVGRDALRLPNTLCAVTPGWSGETQVMQMDLAGFAISAGSACSSGKVGSGRVLRAMGFDEDAAKSAVRVSLGPATEEAEVMAFADAWEAGLRRHRRRAA